MLQRSDDEQMQTVNSLAGALHEWRSLADELHTLGEKQLEILLAPSQESLNGILDRKQSIYQAAHQLSQRVQTLESNLGNMASGISSTDTAACWQEINELRSDILTAMEEIARIESRSELLIQEHLKRIQLELSSIQRKRYIKAAYGDQRGRIPRFLDKAR